MEVFAENQELRQQLMQQVLANDAMSKDPSLNELLAGQASKSKGKSSKGRKSSKSRKSTKGRKSSLACPQGKKQKVIRTSRNICVYEKCRPGEVRDQKSKKCRKSKRKVTKKKSKSKSKK